MRKNKYRKYYPLKKKKPLFKNRNFWLVVFILIFSLSLFYFLFLGSFFQLKEIKISGNQSLSPLQLTEFLESKMEKSIGPFLSRSIFLLRVGKIEKEMLEKFPQIFQVKIKRKLPNFLLVNLKERIPVTIFLINEKQFFIDQEGIIFQEVSQPEEKFLTIKTSHFTLQPKLGEKVLPKETISSILKIESRLKELFDISLTEIFLTEEGRINLKTSEGFEIYFNLKEDLEWQLTKLQVFLEKELLPENRKNLEYIDLRFGNLVPYKYRD